MTFILIGILFIGALGFAFYSYNRTKQFGESAEGNNENVRLETEIRNIVQQIRPNLERTILVNGHFTKARDLVLKTTTFYSYIIAYMEDSHEVQVISYNPQTKAAEDAGTFPLSMVEPITLDDYNMQTNYIFKDSNGKQLFSVQTIANSIPTEGEYQIQYSQIRSYNELRRAFGLPSFQSSKG